MRNMTQKEYDNINKATGAEKNALINQTIRAMLPGRNHDKLLYELNKEYTWEDFTILNDEGVHVNSICKFKVTKIYPKYGTKICAVEYTKGVHKGQFADIPLEDMPLTVEDR